MDEQNGDNIYSDDESIRIHEDDNSFSATSTPAPTRSEVVSSSYTPAAAPKPAPRTNASAATSQSSRATVTSNGEGSKKRRDFGQPQNSNSTVKNSSSPRMGSNKHSKWEMWKALLIRKFRSTDCMLYLFMLAFFNTLYLVYCVHYLREEVFTLRASVASMQESIPNKMEVNLLYLETRLQQNMNEKLTGIMANQNYVIRNAMEQQFSKLIDKIYPASSSSDTTRRSKTNFHEPDSQSENLYPEPAVGTMFSFPSFQDISSRFFSSQQDSINYDTKVQQLTQSLQHMKAKYFIRQPRETFVQILSSVALTLQDFTGDQVEISAPSHPASIIILQKQSDKSSNNGKDLGTCFMKILAKTISNTLLKDGKPYYEKEVDVTYFNKVSNPTAINDDILNHLATKGKVIQVHQVQEIQRQDHLYLFHSFCDNYMAPDPKAVFIFLVTIPAEYEFKTLDQWTHLNGGKIAHDFLSKAWENILDQDKRAPLIARIAASVVLMQNDHGEDSEILNSDECL